MLTPKCSCIRQVVKINTSGFKQERILLVDPATRCVWNFNRKMQLRKQLPLSQLVQVGTFVEQAWLCRHIC